MQHIDNKADDCRDTFINNDVYINNDVNLNLKDDARINDNSIQVGNVGDNNNSSNTNIKHIIPQNKERKTILKWNDDVANSRMTEIRKRHVKKFVKII